MAALGHSGGKAKFFSCIFFFFLINSFLVKNYVFIYLAVSGLSCVMWDLSWQHTYFLGVACRLGSV